MTPIAPFAEVTASELAQILGQGGFPEWSLYRGTPTSELEVDRLILTDADFQSFWIQRAEERLQAYRRLIEEADFLDQPVADFFEHPQHVRRIALDTRSMREWVESRLEQMEESLRLLSS